MFAETRKEFLCLITHRMPYAYIRHSIRITVSTFPLPWFNFSSSRRSEVTELAMLVTYTREQSC